MTEECLRQSGTNVELCCRYGLSLAQLRLMVPKAYTTVNMVSDLRKLTLFSLFELRPSSNVKRPVTSGRKVSIHSSSWIVPKRPKWPPSPSGAMR
ncbi:MAG: hypothetical protein ACTS6A_01120 [Candidatus Hodgkinia cicadicola]